MRQGKRMIEKKRIKQEIKKKSKWRLVIWLILGLFSLVGIFAIMVGVGVFDIKQVVIEGNEQYTDAQIQERILDDKYSKYSLYTYFKYKWTKTEEIPFVDSVEISLLSPSGIKVQVYEKPIVGYLEYQNSNLYFDKDGIVVESSARVIDGVMKVTGLELSGFTLYQELEVKENEVFQIITNLTRLLEKNELHPQIIDFDEENKVTLTFGDVTAEVGEADYLEEKMTRLKALLPELTGEKGVLHLEKYTPANSNIYFSQKK